MPVLTVLSEYVAQIVAAAKKDAGAEIIQLLVEEYGRKKFCEGQRLMAEALTKHLIQYK